MRCPTFAWGAVVGLLALCPAAQADSTPWMETEVVISEAEDLPSVEIVAHSRLHLEAGDPAAAAVVRHPRGTEARRAAVSRLLDDLGIRVGWLPEGPEDGPAIRVTSFETAIAWIERQQVYSLEQLEEWRPREEQQPPPAGFSVLRMGNDLRLHITGPAGTAAIDWQLRVRLGDADHVAVAPLPDRYGNGEAVWRLPVRSDPETIAVRFSVGDEVGRALRTEGVWWRVGRAISYFVGEVLVLLLVLFWATSRRRPGASAAGRRLAAAGVLLSAVSLVCWLANIDGVSLGTRGARWDEFARALASLGLPVIAAALFVGLGRRRLAGWRDGHAMLALAVATALAAAIAFVATRPTEQQAHPGWLAEDAGRWLLAGGSVLLAFTTILLVITGLTFVVLATRPERPVSSARRGRRLWWLAPVFAAVVTVQWVRAVHARLADQSYIGGTDEPAWWEWLATDVRFVPLGVLGRVQNLLVVLAALALLGFIHSVSRGRGAAGFARRSWPVRLLVLGFAGIVIGTGGTLYGGQIPVAFVVALVGTLLLLRPPGGRLRSRPMGDVARRTALAARLECERLRHRLDLLHSRLSAGEVERQEFQQGRERVQRAAREAEARSEPASLALQLGPCDNLYANGIAAARLGAWVGLIPVAYYVVVLVTQRADVELSTESDFGILTMAVGLAAECAFWLTAAFVLGGLFPYIPGRQGVVKGLALGAVFTLSLAISHLVLQGEGTPWSFRALQVVLFLAIVGFLLDRKTMRELGFHRSDLLDIYRVRDVRFLVAYVSPLIVLLLGVAQQLLSGEASNAITQLINAAPTALPPPR